MQKEEYDLLENAFIESQNKLIIEMLENKQSSIGDDLYKASSEVRDLLAPRKRFLDIFKKHPFFSKFSGEFYGCVLNNVEINNFIGKEIYSDLSSVNIKEAITMIYQKGISEGLINAEDKDLLFIKEYFED